MLRFIDWIFDYVVTRHQIINLDVTDILDTSGLIFFRLVYYWDLPLQVCWTSASFFMTLCAELTGLLLQPFWVIKTDLGLMLHALSAGEHTGEVLQHIKVNLSYDKSTMRTFSYRLVKILMNPIYNKCFFIKIKSKEG